MEWKILKLGEVATLITDGTHSTPTYVESGIPFLSVKNIRENRFDLEDIKYITKKEHEQLTKRCNPEKWDILYTKVGTTGIAKTIDIDLEFSIFVSVALIKCDKTKIYPYFLEKVLNSPHARQQAFERTRGTGNKNLVIKDIKQIEIPVPFKNNKPDLAEQKRIADKLDIVFAEVEKGQKITQKQHTLSRSIQHSYLRKMYESTAIQKLRLSYIASLQSGFAFKSADYTKDGFSLIRIANVKNGYIDDTNPVFVPKDIAEEKVQFILNEGDILISLTGNVGRVGVIKKEHLPAVLNQRVSKFVIHDNAVLPEYLFFILNCRTFEERCIAFGKGAAQKNVSNEQVLSVSVPVPTKDEKPDLIEQKRIVGVLDKAFALSEQLGNLFDKQEKSFASLRVSVLNEAFLPKTEAVPVAVPAQPILAPRPFDIQQAVALILKRFERGEMVVAKMLYFAQKIYQVPLGIQFNAQNFGPYDSAVKKAVTAGLSPRNKFFMKKGSGSRQVLALGVNASKILKYSNSALARKTNHYLDETMPYFSKSDSRSIERLATICKIIEDTKVADENIIKEKLHEWKPNKFQDAEVSHTIAFIKKQKWDTQLIK